MKSSSPIRARHLPLAIVLAGFPWAPGVPAAVVIDANLAAQYALIAFSLVILTGWVGQISLGQGAFVGIGAFTTGLLSREWGIPFPVSLPVVAVVTAAVAALLGVVALRVRGLYLAVATLIFAWMADAYLFSASWFVGAGGAASIPARHLGHPEGLTSFDLTDPRVLYLVMLAAVAGAWYAAINLRDSKTGRAFFAVRGSEMAAVSLGIDVIRYKMLAFAISGGLAGIAGNLIMVDLRTVTPSMFQFTVSLFFLGIAVVGGIRSLAGAVAAGALFAGLTEVFFRVRVLDGWLDVVTVGLLLAVLLGYPNGLSGLGRALRDRLRPSRAAGEVVHADPVAGDYGDWRRTAAKVTPPKKRTRRRPVLEARDVTVRFGGLVATEKVSLEVREREIVGLIGPNGAGKTTTFNAIAGLNDPAEGKVHLFGKDVTKLPVHARARMGMGRTFQLIQLFGELTVFENLLVATHVRNPTGVGSHVALSKGAVLAELEAHEQVQRVIGLLGMEEVAGRQVAGLPFGILRQVEIARALVTGSPLLMLDEPASGLDNAETDDLAHLLRFMRASMGVSILLIEHDVRMVTSVSDYMYVLDRGRLLAEGTPDSIQRNPAVVAAYLGRSVSEAEKVEVSS